MKETIKIAIISFIMSALAFFAGVTYTNSNNDQTLEDVTHLLAGYAKVQSFDPQKIAKQITGAGASPAQLASYIERYIKLHQMKGVLLVDIKSVVAKPDFAVSQELTMTQLNELSDKYGIKSEIDYEAVMQEFDDKFNLQ